MSKDIMLDLETLGTTADAVILSIGAVKFNLETGKIDDEGFYRSVSVESNLDLGRRISEDTLILMDRDRRLQSLEQWCGLRPAHAPARLHAAEGQDALEVLE